MLNKMKSALGGKRIISVLLVLVVATFALLSVKTAKADELWDLTGTYTIDFVCTSGCSGTYTHQMTVDDMNLMTGIFSGVGNNYPGSTTWTIVNGNVDGINVSFTIDYNGSSYYVDVEGIIAPDGSMFGIASNASQGFTWSTTAGLATFQRSAEITSPTAGEYVFGMVDFDAVLIDKDGNDNVQWAVRQGTCAAGIGTVFGNVDGHSDLYTWDGANFHASADTSLWAAGSYCFIFNPTESAGDTPIRETRQFYVADGYVNGGGHILEEEEGTKRKDWHDISFGGQVWDLGSEGYVGDWQVNFHSVGIDALDISKFHTTNITAMNFYVGNNVTCHSALNFTAYGELDGVPGYKMIFRAGDNGSPNMTCTDMTDTVRVEIFDPSNVKIYDTHWGNEFADKSSCVGTARTGLDAGNITIVH